MNLLFDKDSLPAFRTTINRVMSIKPDVVRLTIDPYNENRVHVDGMALEPRMYCGGYTFAFNTEDESAIAYFPPADLRRIVNAASQSLVIRTFEGQAFNPSVKIDDLTAIRIENQSRYDNRKGIEDAYWPNIAKCGEVNVLCDVKKFRQTARAILSSTVSGNNNREVLKKAYWNEGELFSSDGFELTHALFVPVPDAHEYILLPQEFLAAAVKAFRFDKNESHMLDFAYSIHPDTDLTTCYLMDINFIIACPVENDHPSKYPNIREVWSLFPDRFKYRIAGRDFIRQVKLAAAFARRNYKNPYPALMSVGSNNQYLKIQSPRLDKIEPVTPGVKFGMLLPINWQTFDPMPAGALDYTVAIDLWRLERLADDLDPDWMLNICFGKSENTPVGFKAIDPPTGTVFARMIMPIHFNPDWIVSAPDWISIE